jgi:hypothetical protein
MALDASQLLGSPQLAGVKVTPKGFTTSFALRMGGAVGVGGVLGGVIGSTASTQADRRQAKMGSEAPHFGGAAYLAVTDGELALIKLKSGLTYKLDEVIGRVPRGEVESAEIREGIAPSLTITFGNGGSWRLEFARVNKKGARGVIRALGV